MRLSLVLPLAGAFQQAVSAAVHLAFCILSHEYVCGLIRVAAQWIAPHPRSAPDTEEPSATTGEVAEGCQKTTTGFLVPLGGAEKFLPGTLTTIMLLSKRFPSLLTATVIHRTLDPAPLPVRAALAALQRRHSFESLSQLADACRQSANANPNWTDTDKSGKSYANADDHNATSPETKLFIKPRHDHFTATPPIGRTIL
jgi:hypothetical protein